MNRPGSKIQYVAGGTVQASDGVYVVRAADEALLRLCRNSDFAYVLTSRQMGKSSLMIRTAERLIQDGIRPIIIDLTELGANTTAEQWYRGFLEKVSEQLELQVGIAEWWTSSQHLSITQRFNRFMADVVLGQVSEPVVVFVDEIDTTLRLDFTDDFFASIRHLYNARASRKELARLSFVLLGVASPGDLMKDAQRTPFNIGYRVDLQDFTEEEAARDLSAEPDLVGSVFRYTSGHPYLTLRVFQSLSERPLQSNLESRIEELFFGDQSEKDSNLQFVRDMLTKRARDREGVLLRYRDVCKGKQVYDQEADAVCAWLRLSGIVHSTSGLLTVRNFIYRRVFDVAWIRRNRKVNWARRSAWGAAVAVGLLVLVAAILAPFAIRKSYVASEQSRLAQKRLLEAEAARSAELDARKNADAAAAMARQEAKIAIVSESEAKRQERIAEENGAIAKTHEFISASLLSLDADPEISVLAGAHAAMAASQGARSLLPQAEAQLHRAILASHVRLTLSGRSSNVSSVAWSPNGKRLATASADKTAKVWDVTGQQLLTLSGHSDAVSSVAWSPDGKQLATASADKTVKVWAVATGQQLLTLGDHSDGVLSVAWSPDGRRLAAGGNDHTAKVWDAETGKELLTLRGHSSSVLSVAWSPDGKRLATASTDSTAKVWDVVTGQELVTLLGHRFAVVSVAWSPDNKLLATASEDGTAKLWDAAPDHELLTLRGQSGSVLSVVWSPDSKRLATASWEGTAEIWDAKTGQQVLNLRAHNPNALTVAWSPDGRRLATGGNDYTAKVWDAETGKEVLTLRGHLSSVLSVVWSPDSTRLATASEDSTAKVWDGGTGKELLTLRGHTYHVSSVAWSPDGKRLATASQDKTAKVWDAGTGKELLTLRGHSEYVFSVAWSPDGKRLATASGDKTAKLWDAGTGKERVTLEGHGDRVLSVAWSPDCTRLATGSEDNTAKVWDAGTGKELLTLRGHTRYVSDVAWSRDGTRLASASADDTVQVYVTDLRDMMALARKRVTAEPSDEGCKRYLQMDKCPAVPNLR